MNDKSMFVLGLIETPLALVGAVVATIKFRGLGWRIAAAVPLLAVVVIHGQTAVVQGRIAEEGSDVPIPSARVLLLVWGSGPRSARTPETVTKDDGTFIFDAVAPGQYVIDAQKAGFAPAVDPSDLDGSAGSRAFNVTADQQTKILDVSLQRSGGIAGQILDPRTCCPPPSGSFRL